MEHEYDKLTEFIASQLSTMQSNTALPVKMLPDEYTAIIIYINGKKGIAVPYQSGKKFYASFAAIEIEDIFIADRNGRSQRVLFLNILDSKLNGDMINNFAGVCANFVNPGENGLERRKLLRDPESWWRHWCKLLGNMAIQEQVYSVVGELMVWLYLLNNNLHPMWTGAKKTRHDFVAPGTSWEVKSTLSHNETRVTVHGVHQMHHGKEKLYLVFCRLEESENGQSLNDLVQKLNARDIDETLIENELGHLGLRIGDIKRNVKYNCVEMRQYTVDESFPAITPKSFKDDSIPSGIVNLTYQLDLSGLEYELINI